MNNEVIELDNPLDLDELQNMRYSAEDPLRGNPAMLEPEDVGDEGGPEDCGQLEQLLEEMQQEREPQGYEDFYLDNLTAEELIERSKLVNKAKRYVELFPDYMESFDTSSFDIMSIEQLDKVIQQQKFIVGTRNSGQFLNRAFAGGVYATECMGPMLKMDLTGLSEAVMKNPETDLLLKELSLEHEELVYTSPALRITMLLGMSMQQVNQYNKQKRMIQEEEKLTEPVNPELKDKYKEL